MLKINQLEDTFGMAFWVGQNKFGFPEKWIDAENRVKAYKQGMLDYGIFTATKV